MDRVIHIKMGKKGDRNFRVKESYKIIIESNITNKRDVWRKVWNLAL
jgi:hypothetical protein